MYTFTMHMRNQNKFVKPALYRSLPPGALEQGYEPADSCPNSRSPIPIYWEEPSPLDDWCSVEKEWLAGHGFLSTGCWRQSSLPAETMGKLFSRWWLMRWLMLSKILSFVRICEGHRGKVGMSHRQKIRTHSA